MPKLPLTLSVSWKSRSISCRKQIKKLDIQSELIKQQRGNLDKIAGHSDKFALALAAGEMQVEQELAIFEKLRTEALKLENEALDLQKARKGHDRRLQQAHQGVGAAHAAASRVNATSPWSRLKCSRRASCPLNFLMS